MSSIFGYFIYSYISSNNTLPTTYPIINTNGSFNFTPSLNIVSDRVYITIEFEYTDQNSQVDGLKWLSVSTNSTYIIEQFDSIPLSRSGYQFYNYLGTFNTNINIIGQPTILSNTSFSNLFSGAINFNQSLSTWDTTNVYDMNCMFLSASNFNQPINQFNTSNVIDMSNMFYGANNFNQPINNWDTSNVTMMNGMFYTAYQFNQSLSNINTSKVTNMSGMFEGAILFNQSLSNFDTSNVIYMGSMFSGAYVFNQSVSNFDTSKVLTMNFMFLNAKKFNQSLLNWDTSNVTTMLSMFSGALEFNQPLTNFQTNNVTTMRSMFYDARSFNSSISSFDTSNVTNMSYMFYNAISFNQSISNFNTSKVESMDGMFYNATSFNQAITTFNTSNVTSMNDFLTLATSFTSIVQNMNYGKISNYNWIEAFVVNSMNYSFFLIDANNTTTATNITLNFPTISYLSTAESARYALIENKNWNITDAGGDISCYAIGTNILIYCDIEQSNIYKPIELLKIGDFVNIYPTGYRKIEYIGSHKIQTNPNNWQKNFFYYKKNNTLLISGWHGLLVDDISLDDLQNYKNNNVLPKQIENKYLLYAGLSNKFIPLTKPTILYYYHLCLEHPENNIYHQYGIWVNNGILSESQSKHDYLLKNII